MRKTGRRGGAANNSTTSKGMRKTKLGVKVRLDDHAYKTTVGTKNNININNTSSETVYTNTKDEYHNLSVPSSEIVRQVVTELFPDVVIENIADNGEINTDNSKEKGEIATEKCRHGKNINDCSDRNSAVALSSLSPSQTLFGQIVRKYLVEKTSKNASNVNNIGGGIGKKKKRKKKKSKHKQQQNESSSSDKESKLACEDILDKKASFSRTTENKPMSIATSKAEKDYSLYSSTELTTPTNESSPPAKVVLASTSTPSQNLGLRQKQLKALFNKISPILQKASNSAPFTTTESLDNRDLPSLIQYLQVRYEEYHSIHNRKVSNSKKNVGSNNNSNNRNHKIESFSSFSKIMPTISLKNIELMCRNITCSFCRRDSLEYINLILDNHKTANTRSYDDVDGGCIFIDWKNGLQEEEEMTSHKDHREKERSRIGGERVASNNKLDVPIVGNNTEYEKLDQVERQLKNMRCNYDINDAFDFRLMEEGSAKGCGALINQECNGVETGLTDKEMIELKVLNKESSKGGVDSSFVFGIVKDEATGDEMLQLQPNGIISYHCGANTTCHCHLDKENNGNNDIKHSRNKKEQITNDSSFPLSVENVDGLFQNVIIPCGLRELEHIPVPHNDDYEDKEQLNFDKKELGENEKEEIRTNAQELVEMFVDLLKKLTSAESEICSVLDERTLPSYYTSATTKSEQFEAKKSVTLQNCDLKCEQYFRDVHSFLLMIHQKTLDARLASHPHQRWLDDAISLLWKEYESAVLSLITTCLEHRWKVIQLGNRPGVVPHLCFSNVLRDYFGEMLKKKFSILSRLQDSFDRILLPLSTDAFDRDGSVPGSEIDDVGASVALVRIAVMASFFSYEKKMDKDDKHAPLIGNGSDNNKEFDFTIEHEYEDLLNSRIDLVCKTIHETNIKDILEIQSKRCQIVFEKSQALTEQMHWRDHSRKPHSIPCRYKTAWDANMIRYEELLQENYNKDRLKSSLDQDKKEFRYLCNLTGVIVEQLKLQMEMNKFLRKEMDKERQCHNSFHLSCLEDIIRSMSDPNDHSSPGRRSNGNKNNSSEKICRGGGGKRRVASMISSCIYYWLQERCMEWHAELMQKELLNLAEKDESLYLDGRNGTLQRAKKSTKKKNKDEKRSIAITESNYEKDETHLVPAPKVSSLHKKNTEQGYADSQISRPTDDGGFDEKKSCDIESQADDIPDGESLYLDGRNGMLQRTKKGTKKKKKEKKRTIAGIESNSKNDETQLMSSGVALKDNPLCGENFDQGYAALQPSEPINNGILEGHISCDKDYQTGDVPDEMNDNNEPTEIETTQLTLNEETPISFIPVDDICSGSKVPERKHVRVGIADESHFESAEDYLIKRFNHYLKMGDTDESFGEKSRPILWM